MATTGYPRFVSENVAAEAFSRHFRRCRLCRGWGVDCCDVGQRLWDRMQREYRRRAVQEGS